MNDNSELPLADAAAAGKGRPILLVPYMWIGDFVRCHSVVSLLRQRFPDRPVDVLSTTLCAPLADYMPGLRQSVVVDLPRNRLGLAQHVALARRLKRQNYAMALMMPRTWKSALAPFLAGIPQRTGFFGEARFVVINDMRFGERKLPRMVDRCAMLALPRGAEQPSAWPLPKLKVAAAQVSAWRSRRGLAEDGRPVVALAPGAVGSSKRWPSAAYAALARSLAADGFAVWVLGGPGEKTQAVEIASEGAARDLTGNDLRDAILALAAAKVAVSNNSGLLHVAAALGTPSIGIFGPTSPWHWAPLNPLAGVVQANVELACRPCHKPVCRPGHHLCMREIAPETVLEVTRRALAAVTAH